MALELHYPQASPRELVQNADSCTPSSEICPRRSGKDPGFCIFKHQCPGDCCGQPPHYSLRKMILDTGIKLCGKLGLPKYLRFSHPVSLPNSPDSSVCSLIQGLTHFVLRAAHRVLIPRNSQNLSSEDSEGPTQAATRPSEGISEAASSHPVTLCSGREHRCTRLLVEDVSPGWLRARTLCSREGSRYSEGPTGTLARVPTPPLPPAAWLWESMASGPSAANHT